MKRSLRNKAVKVVISKNVLMCQMCRYRRPGEPFAIISYSYTNGKPRDEIICWRCCRDAESTLLIQQKWPLAFIRSTRGAGWYLEWTQGVKQLIGEQHETQKTT